MPARAGVRLLLAALVTIFVAANGVNALRKGGDAQDFLEGGRRLLDAAPLYEGSGPASGFIGPPFQAAFFAPFAAIQRVSDRFARLAWFGLSLASLGAGLFAWRSAWTLALARAGQLRLHRPGSFWLALLAVLLPIQTNFEHQNMNTLILAATGVAAWALVTDRQSLSGGFIGLAAAIKAFPVLLVFHLSARGRWRAVVVAVATGALLTLLPLFVYGPRGALAAVQDWLRVGAGGWPTRGQNQSLVAAIDRIVGGVTDAGVHGFSEAPVTALVFGIAAAALALAAILVMARGRSNAAQLPCELAVVITMAVLLSPVAWDHYWLLLFPAFLFVCDAGAPALLGRGGRVVFWTAAVLTSGISRVTVGRHGWSIARDHSASTIAAIALFCALLALWRRLSSLAPDRSML